jgi:hypothetical protein
MTTTTPATDYAAAVAAIADDIIRQIEDGTAPARRCPVLTAGGYYVEAVRVYYADIVGGPWGIPSGVARVALDVSRPRRPAHEVRVCIEPANRTMDATAAAELAGLAIAAAVLDMIDNTAEYAR